MNKLKSFLSKDIKEYNKVILSFGCITFLLCIGIISYFISSSFALFSGEVSGSRNIKMRYTAYTKNFSYKGEPEEYKVKTTGYYYIELGGAQGGDAQYNILYSGGYGAKTSGYIYLEKDTKLYFYVGGQGQTVKGTTTATVTNTGYNSGSFGTFAASNSTHGGGGGATDVRLTGGSWNDSSSLRSRIMVAAGGGGASSHVSNGISYSGTGGDGGTLYGGEGIRANETCYSYGNGAKQVAGGTATQCATDGRPYPTDATYQSGFGDGGGISAYTTGISYAGGGGGGATDVRLEGGSWDNTASLTSRIMVAGGGGGTYTGNAIQGSGGGALYGDQEKRPSNRTTYLSTMPSQTSGYAFGKGGPGMYCTDNTGSGGHGGGYYGAKTGTSCDNRAGGIGGSSYISGYAGANSVSAAGTVSHNLTTKHYSNIYFIGADIIPDQNDGNGHASIRFVGEKPQRKNTNLNNVRYIKDCTNYNSINAANHWIEIQATKDGVNIAKGKTVTGSAAQHATNVYSRITDGDITYSIYANPATQANNQCVTVDLGQTYDLDEVAVWNYFGDQRKYRENTVTVSSDNSTWTSLSGDEVWYETSNGARWNAYIDHINGYRGRTYLTLWYDGYANNGGTKSTATTQTTWKNLIYGTDTTFNGTVMNGTAAGATWGPNYLTLDGSNDWVKIAAMNYARPTLEVVFSPSVTTSSQTYVIGNIEGGGYGIAYQDTNKIWSHFYINGAYRSLQFPTLATPGEIYQAAVSYNQTLYNQYYKGNLVNSISDFAGSIGTTQSSTIMTLGTNPSGSNVSAPYFPGKIYSVRVYSGALTDEQIHHNYLYDKQLFHLD